MKTQVILVAAGLGKRLGLKTPKALAFLKGKPLFVYSLDVFEKSLLIHSVILVAPQSHICDFQAAVKKYRFSKVSAIVKGGSERCDSVAQGLKKIDDDVKLIVVHDAARPFISVGLVAQVLKVAKKQRAAIVAVLVKPTIKLAEPKKCVIKKTLQRSQLWEAQTPQVFASGILKKAYQALNKKTKATDDSALVEALGIPVQIVKGSYQNIKITTPEDMLWAQEFLREKRRRGCSALA